MTKFLKIFYFIGLLLIIACQPNKETSTKTNITNSNDILVQKNQFNDYWYSGTAEINSYELKQSRYGEIREGEAVLVFVTEPFSLNKQVKLDNPNDAGKDNITIMKLNNIKKFITGIYDYSIISSSFTPINFRRFPRTLKLNTSIQEWCGHTFTQLNLKENNYQFQQFSYFEAEGDTKKNIPASLLEEELMTYIRIHKGQLPLGKLDLIFPITYSRFTYKELKVAKAKISKTELDTIIRYNIEYLDYTRKVTIDAQKEFPYKILSWTEDNGDGLLTEARLKKSINEPYWNQKKLSDEAKRKELQLLW